MFASNLTQLDVNIADIIYAVERPPNPFWEIKRDIGRPYYVLGYCTDGEAIYHVNNETKRVCKGDLLLLHNDLSYYGKSNPKNPWSFFSVAFNLESNDPEHLKVFKSMNQVIRGINPHRLTALFFELNTIWTAKSTGYYIRCRSILLELLYLLILETDERRNVKHYKNIKKAIDLINSDLSRTFSSEELAMSAGLSVSHFRLKFKEITGEAVNNYQNRLKISKAVDVLQSGSHNVSETALQMGFTDIYYFSRLFKKLTKKNPSDYI